MRADQKLSLRVGEDVIKKADALVRRIGKDPKIAPLGQVTRSSVLKLALARGLEVLDREYK